MSEIISDGVRSITSEAHGYGYRHDEGYRDAFIGTRNSWTEDNHGSERTAEVIEAIGDNHVAIEKVGMSGLLATEKTAAATNLAVEKTAMSNHLATSLAFSNTQNLLISGFKDGRYDAATNTAAIQAALAACCCEVRALVSAESGKTRDLINSTEALNKATELAEVKLELALAKTHGSNGSND